jgi:hypothetical protein
MVKYHSYLDEIRVSKSEIKLGQQLNIQIKNKIKYLEYHRPKKVLQQHLPETRCLRRQQCSHSSPLQLKCCQF